MPHCGQIYSLHDPDTGELRYIGKTTTTLTKRLKGHLREAARSRTHKSNWILSLSCLPEIRHLCFANTLEELAAAEVREIARAKTEGCRLVNMTAGGDGGSVKGAKRSQETRDRLRENARRPENIQRLRDMSKIPFSPEHIQRLVDSHLNKKPTSEAVEKTASFHRGRMRSQETRTKISESLRGKSLSDTTREALRSASLGKKQSIEARVRRSATKNGREKALTANDLVEIVRRAEDENHRSLAEEFRIAEKYVTLLRGAGSSFSDPFDQTAREREFGFCPVCGRRLVLRKDGSLSAHPKKKACST